MEIKAILSSAAYFPGDVVYCLLSIGSTNSSTSSVLSRSLSSPSLLRDRKHHSSSGLLSTVKTSSTSNDIHPPSSSSSTTPSTPPPSSSSSSSTLSWLASWSPFSFGNGISPSPLSPCPPVSTTTRLAWVSVQIHGFYQLDPKWIQLDSEANEAMESATPLSSSSSIAPSSTSSKTTKRPTSLNQQKSTALTDLTEIGNGRSLFVTPITILACDLVLNPGEEKTFLYHASLPLSVPPTFKGVGVKYGYVLTISAQKFGHPTQQIKYPLRILSPSSALLSLPVLGIEHTPSQRNQLPSHQKYDPMDVGFCPIDASSDKLLVNRDTLGERWAVLKSNRRTITRSLLIEHKKNNILKAVNLKFAELSQPVTFRINKGVGQHIGTFSIERTAYRLGEQVSGAFDFVGGSTLCYQLSVTLKVVQEYSKHLKFIRPVSASTTTALGEHIEYTLFTSKTSFTFTLPVHAPQEFDTDLVSVKWVLFFEFITGVDSPEDEASSSSSSQDSPPDPLVKKLRKSGLVGGTFIASSPTLLSGTGITPLSSSSSITPSSSIVPSSSIATPISPSPSPSSVVSKGGTTTTTTTGTVDGKLPVEVLNWSSHFVSWYLNAH